MNRIEASDKKFKELFGDVVSPTAATDPDFQEILNRFIFGDVFSQGDLPDTTRELITLVVLTAGQNLDQVMAHTFAALNVGVTPVEIKEALYQCAPYIGFPGTLNSLNRVNDVFRKAGVPLPVESQKQVSEDSRFDGGLKVQKSIFGDIIDQLHKNAPENLRHIQNYLSAYCFGDVYTRGGLDLKIREILTLSILIALGGCESQVKSHIAGNLSVGNSRETLIAVITQCLPYVGFPRTLNALACLT